MQIEIIADSIINVTCDTAIVNLFEGVTRPSGATKAIDDALGGLISDMIGDRPDIGEFGQITTLNVCPGIGAKNVVLVGLGKQEEFTLDRLRAAAGVAIRAAAKLRSKTIVSVIHGAGKCGFDPGLASAALAEGTILGSYQFRYYKTEKPTEVIPEKLYIAESGLQKISLIRKGAQTGRIIANAVNMARDLINHPSNYKTPTKMAQQAAEIAANSELEIDILDQDRIEQLNMQAFLAVAQGSNEPPKLIIMNYNGAPGDNRLFAFVGKGITFDSGGISLKPSEGMHEMKDDMAGAAAVMYAMQSIAELKLPVNVIAVAPCTENLPSGCSFKPGDVIGSMAGKTIEIISTDAEGRLILADAIFYARRLGATHIVDLATLTGACVVALGNVASGVMSNNNQWSRQVLEAAAQTGEKMWELPLFDEYKEQIKSDIADLKNSGGRPGGAITAGLFIANFALKTPWVHIDIAGTVSSDKETGYNVKGATGVGVRSLIQLAINLGTR